MVIKLAAKCIKVMDDTALMISHLCLGNSAPGTEVRASVRCMSRFDERFDVFGIRLTEARKRRIVTSSAYVPELDP